MGPKGGQLQPHEGGALHVCKIPRNPPAAEEGGGRWLSHAQSRRGWSPYRKVPVHRANEAGLIDGRFGPCAMPSGP